MKDLSHSGRFNLWQVIGIAASVAVVSAGAAWTVGRAHLGDELEQYRRSENWKVPEAIRKLDELSERLNMTLDEKKSHENAVRLGEELSKENGRLKSKLASFEKDLSEKEHLLAELKLRLTALEGDKFELKEGKSRFLIDHKLAIGVIEIQHFTYICYTQIGNEQATLRPGNTVESSYGDQTVSITLLELTEDGCIFSLAE